MVRAGPDFQVVPLPPGLPALIDGALLFVRLRSDLEGIPEPEARSPSWALV
jgi:hypothetical protein